MSLSSSVMKLLLPKEPAFRRLPLGLGAGIVMNIDFDYQARTFFGLYENEIQGHIKRLVQPGMRCFDLGCYAGYYSLVLAKLCNDKVLAVDGSAENVERTRQNLACNDFPVTVIEGWIAATDDKNFVSLDRLALDYFFPDFIKMDIEGAEANALEGATALLEQQRPNMVIEVHGRDVEAHCIRILESHGYTLLAVSPQAWLPEHRPNYDYNGWLICEGTKSN